MAMFKFGIYRSCATLLAFYFVLETNDGIFLTASKDRARIKRQTGAPVFAQSSYQFPLSTCTAGTAVGSITATGSSGTLSYTLDPASVQGFYVTINSVSGQITLTTNAPSSFSFYARASNTAGTVSVPVTVTCSSSTTVFQGNGLTSSNTNLFSTATYYPNTVVNPYQYSSYNPYSTYNPYSSYGGSNYPQTFTGSNCNAGAIVGNVYVPGASAYFITAGQFSIDASSGRISLAATLGSGTYSVTVQAQSMYSGPVSIPATIYLTCSGYPQFG